MARAKGILERLLLHCFSHARLFVTVWTVACQSPLWSYPGKNTGVSCHFFLQGNLPNAGIKPTSLTSPALVGGFFTTSATWEAWGSATYKPVQKYFNILTPGNFNHSAYQLYISPGPRRTLLAIYSVSTPSTDIENSLIP